VRNRPLGLTEGQEAAELAGHDGDGVRLVDQLGDAERRFR
jgi:hypothetical protein